MCLQMKPENFQSALSGKHKKRDGSPAIRYPNKWGDSIQQRCSQFSTWKDVALQVIQREKGSFRLIAIFSDVFDPIMGECLWTNEQLARRAGRCTEKTIQREITALRDMGLIRLETTWIEKAGKKVKGRRITLAMPIDLNGIEII